MQDGPLLKAVGACGPYVKKKLGNRDVDMPRYVLRWTVSMDLIMSSGVDLSPGALFPLLAQQLAAHAGDLHVLQSSSD
jgi:hypothetical protein